MFLLFFFILLIQFFNYWIFTPLAYIFEYVLQIKLFPIISIVVLILLFSGKNIENK